MTIHENECENSYVGSSQSIDLSFFFPLLSSTDKLQQVEKVFGEEGFYLCNSKYQNLNFKLILREHCQQIAFEIFWTVIIQLLIKQFGCIINDFVFYSVDFLSKLSQSICERYRTHSILHSHYIDKQWYWKYNFDGHVDDGIQWICLNYKIRTFTF